MCKMIENASDSGNTSVMYDGIDDVLDPSAMETARLQSSTNFIAEL